MSNKFQYKTLHGWTSIRMLDFEHYVNGKRTRTMVSLKSGKGIAETLMDFYGLNEMECTKLMHSYSVFGEYCRHRVVSLSKGYTYHILKD